MSSESEGRACAACRRRGWLGFDLRVPFRKPETIECFCLIPNLSTYKVFILMS